MRLLDHYGFRTGACSTSLASRFPRSLPSGRYLCNDRHVTCSVPCHVSGAVRGSLLPVYFQRCIAAGMHGAYSHSIPPLEFLHFFRTSRSILSIRFWYSRSATRSRSASSGVWLGIEPMCLPRRSCRPAFPIWRYFLAHW